MQRSSGDRSQAGRRRSGRHPIDVHVGSRVRLRRNMLGLSQEKLGQGLGVSFQQVQKYERGANRIGASRLLEIARILDVPIAFFYDEVDPVRAPAIADGFSEPARAIPDDPLRRPETIDLVEAYYDIPDTKLRRHLFELAMALSRGGHSENEDRRRKGRTARASRT